jgi:hypothetical protein
MRSAKNFNCHDGILTAELKDANGIWNQSQIKVHPGFKVIN